MRVIIGFLLVAAACAAPVHHVEEPIANSYIIKLRNDANLDDVISSVRLSGGKIGSVYRNVFKGFAVKLPSKVLALISKLPSIEYIEEDATMHALEVGSWGLDRIDNRFDFTGGILDDEYHPPLTGAGVTVYVIDTGVNDQHVDFEGRAHQVFCAEDLLEGPIGGGNVDCDGHGTHCAGTVGSKTYGVAKGVKIIGVKVLNCFGSGSTSGVISGIEWVIQEASRYPRVPAVASMSLGGGASDAMDDAVNAMVDAGILTAVAAGNSNADACNTSPARSTKVVTVGSTTINDIRSSFSNYGHCVDIFAPGSAITSTWIGSSNTATNTISGTSMACPHVAGALALYGSREALIQAATPGVVTNPGDRSINLQLYVRPKPNH